MNVRARARLLPFGQVLFGGIYSRTAVLGETSSGTARALMVGGGGNLMASSRLGARIGADYLRTFVGRAGQNGFRFTTGAVILF
jgi:hypothetical protein